MAIDEELLRTAHKPLLRIYFWLRPSVSFGYFGKHAEVEEQWPDRELVRRWTGGGIVPHGTDLTYTLVVPRQHAFSRSRAVESYALIHEKIAGLLATQVRLPLELAASAAPKISGACFENPAQHDIMAGAEKIAGAAQRRTQWGLLHQGSIQIPSLPPDFGLEFANTLAARVSMTELPDHLLDQAAALATAKYGSDAWLRRF